MDEEQNTRQQSQQEGFDQFDPFDAMDRDQLVSSDDEQFPAEQEERLGNEMTFFDHLGELRTRIIRSLLAVLVTSLLCAIFMDFLVEKVLLAPAIRVGMPIQNTETMGQITIALQVILYSGVILAIPAILWQFWQFIKPGLYKHERQSIWWISICTIFCFLGGVSFSYFVMIPTSLKFAVSFVFEGVENRLAITSYLSFVLGFILATGAVFEMPVLSYVLSYFGILKPDMLGKYRRHAVVVLLIVAAIITPTPDFFNQLFLAVPLYGLYEISILISKFASRKREKRNLAEAPLES